MQFKRRYAHLTIVITAYAFLILAGRWAFFTEMWSIMGAEPNVDGGHAHALDLDYRVQARTQRDVTGFDTTIRDSRPEKLKYKNLNKSEIMRALKSDYIARMNKRHQLLQSIFTNFLHP